MGERVWPSFAFKSIGLMLLTASVLCAMGGLAQINAVWLYGPFNPAEVSSASQPDWYMGWLDGALRLYPAWEIRAFGFEVPGAVLPGGRAGRGHLHRAVPLAVHRGPHHGRPATSTTCSTDPATRPGAPRSAWRRSPSSR